MRYLWNFDKRVREKIVEIKSCFPNVAFYKIKNQKELSSVLKILLDEGVYES